MDFLQVVRQVCRALDAAGTRYALIGGLAIADGLDLPVVQAEDIIGLKVQAAVNDPQRAETDWADSKLLIEAAAHLGQSLDWTLLADYLDIFGLAAELPCLEGWYGEAQRH